MYQNIFPYLDQTLITFVNKHPIDPIALDSADLFSEQFCLNLSILDLKFCYIVSILWFSLIYMSYDFPLNLITSSFHKRVICTLQRLQHLLQACYRHKELLS